MKLLFLPCLLLSVLPLPAQTDNFNDGNDAGWTRFAPLEATGGTTYTFPSGGYRLASAASPLPLVYGPARASALLPGSSYSDFSVSVDITGWSGSSNTSVGFLARLQPNPTPGDVNAYALTYQASDHDLEINRIIGEVPTKISPGLNAITLNPAKIYRLVFFGYGAYLEGRLYDKANLAVPLITVKASDTTFDSGSNGLFIFSARNTAAAATFDNYQADAGPAPLIQLKAPVPGTLRLQWNAQTALCWRLETSPDLLHWLPQPAVPLDSANNQVLLPAAALISASASYYRFAKGPLPE